MWGVGHPIRLTSARSVAVIRSSLSTAQTNWPFITASKATSLHAIALKKGLNRRRKQHDDERCHKWIHARAEADRSVERATTYSTYPLSGSSIGPELIILLPDRKYVLALKQ